MTFPKNAHRRVVSQSGSRVRAGSRRGVWDREGIVESEEEEEGTERKEEVVKLVMVITSIFLGRRGGRGLRGAEDPGELQPLFISFQQCCCVFEL